MEDHLHFLVEGIGENSHFISMMTLLRQRTAIAYSRLANRRLWQDGYFERVLRPTDNVFDTIEYIRNNPASAGLSIERSRSRICGGRVTLTLTHLARGFSRASETRTRNGRWTA
jgi:hypothetical protein